MKIIITAFAVLFCSVVYCQSLTGKWKPITFSLDGFARGDVKADTIFISEAIKDNVKDDKDPAFSEELVRVAMKGMLRKAKETQEEYFADGKYEETNTRTGRKKTGTYVFNKTANTLERTMAPLDKKENFTISWKNDQLVLITEMESSNGKKGKLEVVYEKL